MKRNIGFVVCVLVLTILFGSFGVCGAQQTVTDGENFYKIGDANADGRVDIIDLVAVKKYKSGSRTDICLAADMDGNGEVNAEDIVLIRKMLLGISVDDEIGACSEKY